MRRPLLRLMRAAAVSSVIRKGLVVLLLVLTMRFKGIRHWGVG